MNPLISVVVPCYKQAHFLADSIGSLTAQTYPHWEAVVVDDGSPDNVQAVCEQLHSVEPRVRYFRKTNGGLSSARNAGIERARGQLVQFLDADDLLLPGKFAQHVEAHRSLPGMSVSYTDYWHGLEDDPMKRAPIHKADVRLSPLSPLLDLATRWEHFLSIPIHAAIVPQALLAELGPQAFDSNLPNHEDWDFWMRLATRAATFHFINEELAVYRVSESSMSRDVRRMWAGFRLAIKKQRALNGGNPDVLRALQALSLRNDYRSRLGIVGHLRVLTESAPFRSLPWPVQRVGLHCLRIFQ